MGEAGLPAWAIAVLVVIVIVTVLTLANHYGNPPKCPNCKRPIKSSPFMFSATKFRCQCGARVSLAPGMWSNHITDWEMPPDRSDNGGLTMLDEFELRELDTRLLIIRFLWAVISFVPLLVYVVIANVPDFHPELSDDPDAALAFDIMRYWMYGTSAVVLYMAYRFRKRAAAPDAAGPSAEAVSIAAARYQTGIILTVALCEAVGIYGFVLCLIDSDFLSLYLLVGIAAVSLWLVRPRRAELIELAAAIKAGSF